LGFSSTSFSSAVSFALGITISSLYGVLQPSTASASVTILTVAWTSLICVLLAPTSRLLSDKSDPVLSSYRYWAVIGVTSGLYSSTMLPRLVLQEAVQAMALTTGCGAFLSCVLGLIVMQEYQDNLSKKNRALRLMSVVNGGIIALVGLFTALITGASFEDKPV
jgi:hypothetical protein